MILLTHPHLAEIPVPDGGFGATSELRYALDGFLRHHDHRRWPDSKGLTVAAYAFAAESDADAFVAVFRERGARRITP